MDEKTVSGTNEPAHHGHALSRQVTVEDEATLFASPLPITGERKTTTRKELWVGSGSGLATVVGVGSHTD